jgi:hypothetical protein
MSDTEFLKLLEENQLDARLLDWFQRINPFGKNCNKSVSNPASMIRINVNDVISRKYNFICTRSDKLGRDMGQKVHTSVINRLMIQKQM